jgi:hypothetical protein
VSQLSAAVELGQILPGDAGLEHKQDAGEGLAIIEPRLTTFWARCPLGEDRRDNRPEFVGQEWLGHEVDLSRMMMRKLMAIGVPNLTV